LEVKEIENRIKKLKTKLAEKGGAATDQEGVKGVRETRKKLKRAQRRKKVMTVRAAYIESKGKKKVKKGEGDKAAPG
jgi:cell division septum initiation protein DivIVA